MTARSSLGFSVGSHSLQSQQCEHESECCVSCVLGARFRASVWVQACEEAP